jgi:ubiquinone/menaquinone biosynthesis C-methylase UbiE
VHHYPWWVNYTFDNAWRRLFHKPERMLAPFLDGGMTALDLGCGMGFFTLGMASLVGDAGRVIAVDVRPKVLGVLVRRARRDGVAERIETHAGTLDELGLEGGVDFALAFWMLHEADDRPAVCRDLRAALKPGGKLLVAEPRVHVSGRRFLDVVAAVQEAGMQLVERPRVALSRAAIFEAAGETER